MTGSDETPFGPDEWWAPYPGARNYQFSAAGRVRSIDHMTKGKRYRGKILTQRPSGRPPGKPLERRYRLVNIRLDAESVPPGEDPRKTVLVHVGIVLARIEGGKVPEGMEVCHNDGNGAHNWWANLRVDTLERNRVDRYGWHIVKPVSTNVDSHTPWLRRIARRFVTKRDKSPTSRDNG